MLKLSPLIFVVCAFALSKLQKANPNNAVIGILDNMSLGLYIFLLAAIYFITDKENRKIYLAAMLFAVVMMIFKLL